MSFWPNQKGDTLVEVAIAFAILSVMLVTAYNVADLSIRTSMQARERVQAVRLAQQQAELLRGMRDGLTSQQTYFTPAQLLPCQTGCYIDPTSIGAIKGGTYSPPNMPLYTVSVTEGPTTSSCQNNNACTNFVIDTNWTSAVNQQTIDSKLNFSLANTTGIANHQHQCDSRPEDCYNSIPVQ